MQRKARRRGRAANKTSRRSRGGEIGDVKLLCGHPALPRLIACSPRTKGSEHGWKEPALWGPAPEVTAKLAPASIQQICSDEMCALLVVQGSLNVSSS